MTEPNPKGEHWAQKAARAFARDDFLPQEQNNTNGTKVPMRPHVVFCNPVPYLPDSERNAATEKINQKAEKACQDLDMSKFKTQSDAIRSVVEQCGGR